MCEESHSNMNHLNEWEYFKNPWFFLLLMFRYFVGEKVRFRGELSAKIHRDVFVFTINFKTSGKSLIVKVFTLGNKGLCIT